MNFKNVTAGLCAAVMALTMLPAMPIEVQAAEAPAKKVYTPHIDTSKFVHATGTPMDNRDFGRELGHLTGKITFSKEPYPGAGGIALNGSSYNQNKDTTVYAVISGQDATIYSKDGGGIFAPEDSSYLFHGEEYEHRRRGMDATSYDLSGLDTSKVTNMSHMFFKSDAVNLDLTSFDTSKVTDMNSIFKYANTKSVDLSNLDTGNVADMHEMFAYSQIESCDLSNFNTSKVTNMAQMFAGSPIPTLNLSNFDTSNVTDMNNMFRNAWKINSIDLSSLDTSSVTNMSGMFSYCSAKSINLSGVDTSNVTNMSSMFSDSFVRSIDLSTFNTSKVTNMAYMFNNIGYGISYQNINLSNFDTSKVTNMEGMFLGGNVYSLDLSNFDTSNVTNMKNMFSSSRENDVLCRTEEDANKMKNSPNCSATGFHSVHTGSGEIVYNWSEDAKQCYATRNCKCGGGDSCPYNKIEATNISSIVGKEPSCGVAGDTKYTATFAVPWASEQTKTVVGNIPATGKHVYDDDFDAECNVCGQQRAQKTNTIPINEITFPDGNFRNWVLDNVDGKNGAPVMLMSRSAPVNTKDGQLDNTEQQATGTIDVNSQGIKDLRGIEYFPNLTVLDVSNNDLTDLNVSNNPKLESLDATNNPNLDKVHVNENLNDQLKPNVDQDTIVEYVPPFTNKNSGEGNNIPVTLKTVAHTFSVTVPTSLPISVAADGTISCADASACKVINNEEGPVDIKSVTLAGDNQWIIVPISTAMESEAVNTKKLAMTVMGYETNDGGLNTASFVEQTINGNADFGIVYTAKLPTQTVEADKAPVANVVFTIGWHEAA